MKPLPQGCDQQGRYPEPPEHDPVRVVMIDAAIAAIVITAISVIVWSVI